VCGRELAGGFDRADGTSRGVAAHTSRSRTGPVTVKGAEAGGKCSPQTPGPGVIYRLVSEKRPHAGGGPPGDVRLELEGAVQTGDEGLAERGCAPIRVSEVDGYAGALDHVEVAAPMNPHR